MKSIETIYITSALFMLYFAAYLIQQTIKAATTIRKARKNIITWKPTAINGKTFWRKYYKS